MRTWFCAVPVTWPWCTVGANMKGNTWACGYGGWLHVCGSFKHWGMPWRAFVPLALERGVATINWRSMGGAFVLRWALSGWWCSNYAYRSTCLMSILLLKLGVTIFKILTVMEIRGTYHCTCSRGMPPVLGIVRGLPTSPWARRFLFILVLPVHWGSKT